MRVAIPDDTVSKKDQVSEFVISNPFLHLTLHEIRPGKEGLAVGVKC